MVRWRGTGAGSHRRRDAGCREIYVDKPALDVRIAVVVGRRRRPEAWECDKNDGPTQIERERVARSTDHRRRRRRQRERERSNCQTTCQCVFPHNAHCFVRQDVHGVGASTPDAVIAARSSGGVIPWYRRRRAPAPLPACVPILRIVPDSQYCISIKPRAGEENMKHRRSDTHPNVA